MATPVTRRKIRQPGTDKDDDANRDHHQADTSNAANFFVQENHREERSPKWHRAGHQCSGMCSRGELQRAGGNEYVGNTCAETNDTKQGQTNLFNCEALPNYDWQQEQARAGEAKCRDVVGRK